MQFTDTPSTILFHRYKELQDHDALKELAARIVILNVARPTSVLHSIFASVSKKLIPFDHLQNEIARLLSTLPDEVLFLISSKLQSVWDEPRALEKASKEAEQFIKHLLEQTESFVSKPKNDKEVM